MLWIEEITPGGAANSTTGGGIASRRRIGLQVEELTLVKGLALDGELALALAPGRMS